MGTIITTSGFLAYEKLNTNKGDMPKVVISFIFFSV